MKKSNNSKYIFAEVLSCIIDEFNICIADICRDPDNDVEYEKKLTQSNVSSWKSRNPPRYPQQYDHLCFLLKKRLIKLNLNEYVLQNDFAEQIGDIFSKFSLSDEWDTKANGISEYPDLIIAAISFAYEHRKAKKNHAYSTMVTNNADHRRKKMRRIVVFDLDGTLIKGIKYSWTLLYSSVGLSTEQCKINKKMFENGDLSYPNWVKYDLMALKEAGLTKEIAQNAAREKCRPTRNFIEAINKLKSANCAVGIISGGADVVMYSLFPDADTLFDNNIYINRLIFNEQTGELLDIEATPYDWDDDDKVRGVSGKHEGLKKICAKYGVGVENAIFVGDDDNDFKAMKIAGTKILYSSPDDDVLGTGSRKIPEGVKIVNKDDLLIVADIILSELEADN